MRKVDTEIVLNSLMSTWHKLRSSVKMEPYLRKWVQFLTEVVIIEPAQVGDRSSTYIFNWLAWYFYGSTKSRNDGVSDSFIWSWDSFLLRSSILNHNVRLLASLIVSYYALFGWYPWKAYFFSEERWRRSRSEGKESRGSTVKGEETEARMYWKKIRKEKKIIKRKCLHKIGL